VNEVSKVNEVNERPPTTRRAAVRDLLLKAPHAARASGEGR
jgi:hypothetical protein